MALTIIKKKDSHEVSSLGQTLTDSVEASEDVLSVARDLQQKALETEDESQQALFKQWADRLAQAVIVATTSASGTATQIQSLYPETDDKREER